MDTPQVLALPTYPNWTLGTGGGPKFADVYEIGNFKQAEVENSDEN